MADIEAMAMEIADKAFGQYHPNIDIQPLDVWRAYALGVIQAHVNADYFGDEFSLNRIRAAVASEKYFLQMIEAAKLTPAIKGE